MIIWSKETNNSIEWTEQYNNVLYLLTEDNQNLLDEEGGLIAIDWGGVGIYTKETEDIKNWDKKTNPIKTWTKKSISSSIWI
jgi:hypothetical protein